MPYYQFRDCRSVLASACSAVGVEGSVCIISFLVLWESTGGYLRAKMPFSLSTGSTTTKQDICSLLVEHGSVEVRVLPFNRKLQDGDEGELGVSRGRWQCGAG
jgi:hypothetical protein